MKSCGTCTLCCKVVGVQVLDKPPGRWCTHLRKGVGCGIYGSHPAECQSFACVWLTSPELDETWKPEKSKLVLHVEDEGARFLVSADPGSPGRWRQPAFLPTLRAIARHRWDNNEGPVIVLEGSASTLLLPDQEIALGIIANEAELFIGHETHQGVSRPVVEIRDPDGTVRTCRGQAG